MRAGAADGADAGALGLEPVIHISVFDDDPSKAFLDRFADVRVPVVARSRFRRNRGHLRFDIESIELVDETHAIVESGYYEGRMSLAGYRVWLEWRSGRWTVTERKLLVIA